MAHQDLSPFKELPIYTILQQRKVIAKRILDGKKENLEVYEEMIEYANQLLKDYFGI